MKIENRLIIILAAAFLVIALFLKFIGILNFTYAEFAAYMLIFSGVGVVYSTIGKNEKKLLFAGVIAFLIGIELFITSKYEIVKLSNVILPSIFFILGTAFLVLFIDDLSSKLMLTISLIFFISGIYFFSKLGKFSFSDFFNSALSIAANYWHLIIVIAVIIILLNKKSEA